MAKLTKQQISILENIEHDLNRAYVFIMEDKTIVTRVYGGVPCKIDKHIGSHLCGLEMGLDKLRKFRQKEKS